MLLSRLPHQLRRSSQLRIHSTYSLRHRAAHAASCPVDFEAPSLGFHDRFMEQSSAAEIVMQDIDVAKTQLMQIPIGFAVYTALWLAAGTVVMAVCIRRRSEFALLSRAYGRALSVPWKVATFAIALVGMVWLGPRSGDPTWDATDAAFMSVLTYLSAPWVVGTWVRVVRRRARLAQGLVAAWIWMFSASWSYDIYIWLRDGSYPPSWLANIGASSVLYALAGLLWSLEWIPGRGLSLSFLHEPWPSPAPLRNSFRVLLAALPVVVLVAALMLGFFFH